MARGTTVAVSLAPVALGAALIWWFALRGNGEGGGASRTHRASPTRRGVDVETYRASYRQRLASARQVAARRRAAAARPRNDVDAARAAAARTFLMRDMMEPRCILGPGELCAALDEPVTDCADGDAGACLAVGQYLADTPPRPLIAISFFHYACKAGDEEGCRRMKEVKEPMTASCADDPFRCGWLAARSQDPAQLDAACTEGVADACAFMEHLHVEDTETSRTYLEAACQLGSPLACQELGRRLMPGCEPERPLSEDGQPMYFPCYPPDPVQAAEARAIACEAGFEEACT